MDWWHPDGKCAQRHRRKITEWQTIEIAPKNTWVLLWVRPGRLDFIDPASPCIGEHDSRFGWIDESGETIKEEMTHWMPLPAPPK